jgi:hypothetical protein
LGKQFFIVRATDPTVHRGAKMEKREIKVISSCDTKGMLWPRAIFWKDRQVEPCGISHTCSLKSATSGGPQWHSYRCRIDGKKANVTYNGATQSWFMSFCENRLSF